MDDQGLLYLLASFFNVSSIEEFLLVLFSSVVIVLILTNATYLIVKIWFPHINSRLYITVTALWTAVVALSAWLGLSQSEGNLLYKGLTAIVLWASIFLMVVGIQHFVDRLRKPEDTRL